MKRSFIQLIFTFSIVISQCGDFHVENIFIQVISAIAYSVARRNYYQRSRMQQRNIETLPNDT